MLNPLKTSNNNKIIPKKIIGEKEMEEKNSQEIYIWEEIK